MVEKLSWYKSVCFRPVSTRSMSASAQPPCALKYKPAKVILFSLTTSNQPDRHVRTGDITIRIFASPGSIVSHSGHRFAWRSFVLQTQQILNKLEGFPNTNYCKAFTWLDKPAEKLALCVCLFPTSCILWLPVLWV